MRIFALELNNDIKGIEERKKYIEGLISKLDRPEGCVIYVRIIGCRIASSEEEHTTSGYQYSFMHRFHHCFSP